METIGNTKLWSILAAEDGACNVSNNEVRKSDGCLVTSFLDLATKTAELQFRNRDHVLMFRGQSVDYRNNQGSTTLKPSLFRSPNSSAKVPRPDCLKGRFDVLRKAEKELIRLYSPMAHLGLSRLRRQRILRWSLLQHYEICKTPLLDVTHSLRIAASFASIGASAKAYVFVLGVPNLSGAITASAESGLQIIRLASVCPPSAVRPHIQEGYVLGEYPDFGDFEQKENYKYYEIDFGRRLVTKFRFDPEQFWKKDTFPKVRKNDLYPNASDPLYTLAQKIKARLPSAED